MMSMKLLYFLLCFFCITSSNEGTLSVEEQKVFNGFPTKILQRPYMAALVSKLRYFCSACQIASKWLATAAHCLLNMTNEVVQARVGSSFSERDGLLHSISRTIPHPNFSKISMANDLLLIELDKEIKPTRTSHAISLAGPTRIFKSGTSMMISGWGLIAGAYHTDILQSGVAKLITNAACIQAYKKYYNTTRLELNPREFCASAGRVAACPGDSGAPGVIDGELAGILSRGSGKCVTSSVPSIFTRISDFYYWIQKTISS